VGRGHRISHPIGTGLGGEAGKGRLWHLEPSLPYFHSSPGREVHLLVNQNVSDERFGGGREHFRKDSGETLRDQAPLGHAV